jgi:hypothetical protein
MPTDLLAQIPVGRLLAAGSMRDDDLTFLLVLLICTTLDAAAFVVLVRSWRRVVGTTLVAPLAWGAVSYVTLLTATALLLCQPNLLGIGHDKWFLVAVTSTFCPTMSLLGAKRPQHRAWQWIVLSLWIVAAMPAIQALIAHEGEPMELHPLWKWFYLLLVVIGCANYLPTRFCAAALLMTAGQSALFGNFLPGPQSVYAGLLVAACVYCAPARLRAPALIIAFVFLLHLLRDWSVLPPPIEFTPFPSVVFFSAAVLLADWLAARRPTPHPKITDSNDNPSFNGWNRVWLDFRDFYGLIWGVRVMERIKAIVEQDGGLWFDWDGFHTVPRGGNILAENHSALTAECADQIAQLEPALRNLLRRFVSNDWIDKRLQETISAAAITS